MITQKELKKELSYNKVTGVLLWAKNSRGRRLTGFAGGVADSGYLCVSINKKTYKAHVLAWVYEKGEFPKGEIDHINGNKLDNRIKNLRDVSHGENLRNQKLNKHNTSGCSGVSFHKQAKKWRAVIGVNGKAKVLGLFTNKVDAIKSRKDAEIEFGYHERHGRIQKTPVIKNKYEMQIKTKIGKWRSFDCKSKIKDLEENYQAYNRHSKYDARIIKITTVSNIVKET